VSVYLLYLNTAQKVETVEHGTVRGLAAANPKVCETRALAKDYLAIEAGDEIIGCNGGKPLLTKLSMLRCKKMTERWVIR
jgi:hypothetical protein